MADKIVRITLAAAVCALTVALWWSNHQQVLLLKSVLNNMQATQP